MKVRITPMEQHNTLLGVVVMFQLVSRHISTYKNARDRRGQGWSEIYPSPEARLRGFLCSGL